MTGTTASHTCTPRCTFGPHGCLAVAERVTGWAPTTVSDVPNKPKTPISNFRIPEDVKTPAMERAAAEGKTLTDVVVEHLRRYGRGGKREAGK